MEHQTIYKMAFDVWKSQVESFWTRASYNVVFQLALLTGFLKLNEEKHWGLIVILSIAALVLTFIWFKTSQRMNDYIRYYWERLGELESQLDIPAQLQIFAPALRRIGSRRGQYRWYVLSIPLVCAALWIVILTWSVRKLV